MFSQKKVLIVKMTVYIFETRLSGLILGVSRGLSSEFKLSELLFNSIKLIYNI